MIELLTWLNTTPTVHFAAGIALGYWLGSRK
ncbi:hypothetical protein EVB39_079 [Rhizobium phage RHph_TM3_3_9]|nr:hypothetical protein EVB39_079 [Rhizobium phage RHph_TM3_3_9]QIG68600.1 hypothetical protein EVB66_079 [Rhizobium phage RHph_TM3_3_13]QIG74458.1 hypothetical protein EVC09_078 [Rhizobium phage RHph_TM3_3_10]QXV74572.1 hypothetical protein [Rhizobium phage RHEph19]